MSQFLGNPKKGSAVDENNNILFLSEIFSWYGADITQFNTTVQAFLLPYMANSEEQSYVTRHLNDIKLKYFEYDWQLNGDAPCNCSI